MHRFLLMQGFPHFIGKRFIYPIRKVLFLDESGHEPQLRAVHASGATAKEAKMGGEARPSGSGVGLMHRLPLLSVYAFTLWLHYDWGSEL